MAVHHDQDRFRRSFGLTPQYANHEETRLQWSGQIEIDSVHIAIKLDRSPASELRATPG